MASKLFVAAIDFGTTFSGWAYSSSDEYQKEPTKVYVRSWPKGNLSPKAPTSVLIKPDGKTFEAFGYDAEDRYAQLADTEDHKSWYYFRRFKMRLHNMTTEISSLSSSSPERPLRGRGRGRMRRGARTRGGRGRRHAVQPENLADQALHIVQTRQTRMMSINRTFEIMDETGKSLRAMTIFTMAISFLKDDLLQLCKTRIVGEITSEEITWVLTVPAIWNDSAKQFMREAAVEAGIPSDNLIIALEPECASIFCRLLKVEKKMAGDVGFSVWKEGSQYMVLDAGGGTVDITVHKLQQGQKLQELHKASGGAWGGTQVDDAFEKFIISIVGSRVYETFVKCNMEDYVLMFRDFEIKKREVEPGISDKIIMRVPYSLQEIFEKDSSQDLQKTESQKRCGIIFKKDKLRIEAGLMKQLFQDTIDSITDHVRELLAKPEVKGTTHILMVGGFSESKMLQDAVRNNFPDMKIIVPEEAGLAVLKGAVIYGHCPTAVATRIARYTYGFETEGIFVEGYHDESKKRIEHWKNISMAFCSHIFTKNVQVGQDISADEEVCNGPFVPSDYEDLFFDLNIYASTNKSPKYVTDADCFKIGTLRVYPDDPSIPREERRYKIFMTYGGTEIKVRVVESNTGKTTNATIDFLA